MTVTACMEAWFFGLPVHHQLRGVAATGSNTLPPHNVFGSSHLSYSVFNLYTRDGMINFLSSALPKRI